MTNVFKKKCAVFLRFRFDLNCLLEYKVYVRLCKENVWKLINVNQSFSGTTCIELETTVPHRKPQNNNENVIIVETNPVNNIHIEIPMIGTVVAQPVLGMSKLLFFFLTKFKPLNTNNNMRIFLCTVSPCSDCTLCDCEMNEEKPCRQCNRPCKCERPPCIQCEMPCCANSPPCFDCSVPVEIITTIEIIESCPLYEEVIYNDEPQLIETNYTLYSTYNITESELVQQQLEVQIFQNEQQFSRKGLCGGGGLHGIRGDEEQHVATNSSEISTSIESQNQTKGHLIAGIANHHNNRPTKPCQITSGWACRKIGRHRHPSNCQKYVQCHICGENSVYECPYEHAFDGRQCSSDWSSCGSLPRCSYDRALLPDPWNSSNYFVCVRKKGTLHKFFVFRRFCPEGHEFDVVRQQCYRIKVIIVKPPCKRGCNSG